MSKRHTVSITEEVYKKLKHEGRFGETYSELVARLIDKSEKSSGGKHHNDY
jgi:predicted CopG family antitoxin